MFDKFGYVVTLGGLRDRETLESLSSLLGEHPVEVPTHGKSYNFPTGNAPTDSVTMQYRPMMTPAEICRIPKWWVLVIHPTGWHYAYTPPWFSGRPWNTFLRRCLSRSSADPTFTSGTASYVMTSRFRRGSKLLTYWVLN
jgi:hypothetical protein